EARSELGIPSNCFVVCYIGRLIPLKRVDDLIEAISALKLRLNRPLSGLFVGSGALLSVLSKRAAAAGVDAHWVGFQGRRGVAKYLAASDLLVNPSSSETWGVVLNEAIAFGLPVIASDQVAAGYDLVFPGVNGDTYPVGDIQRLTDLVYRAATDGFSQAVQTNSLLSTRFSSQNAALGILKAAKLR
ncbi:MAG: glycosyltransferase, partial [Myxococcota bacterium]